MAYRLVKDKLPEQVKESGKVCLYATAESDELYLGLLRGKLIDTVNSFLNTNALEELIEVQLVIDSIKKQSKTTKAEWDGAYKSIVEKDGGYDKKYILFYEEPKQTKEKPEAEKTEAANN